MRLLPINYPIHVRAIILPFIDSCCGLFSGFFAWIISEQYPIFNGGASTSWYAILGVGLFWASAPHFIDGYNAVKIRYRRFHIEIIGKVTSALIIAILVAVVLYQHLPVPTGFLILCLALSPAIVLLGRSIGTDILQLSRFRRNVLIIGAGWAGKTIVREMLERSVYGYNPVGFIDRDPMLHHSEIEGIPVLGSDSQLLDIVDKLGVDIVVVAITHGIQTELSTNLYQVRRRNISVVRMTEMYEMLTQRVPINHLPEHWVREFIEGIDEGRPMEYLPRRILNYLSGLLLFALFLPIFPIIALCIFLVDGRPILFTQERVGIDEKLFILYKFRTMRAAEDDDDVGSIGNSWKKRITRTGKFLRAVRFDELPQLYNVIRNEIYLVGPRPFIPQEVDRLSSIVPYYNLRFRVKPGITGHAQLSAGYENDPETALIKLEYDLFYIKYRSIWLDLAIIIRTVSAVIRRKGK